ncbi:DUF2061 domain-containing protein [Tropicimonas sp.]|uniref:DUF2061 domain-containing protein n=1 Tax=Tropicimonas sp. TaxID=2067044 RepID=UPI003A87DCEE
MNDTPLRSVVKAMTWQASGLISMTAITWAVTGSVATGGAIALAGACFGCVSYVLHERIWARIGWGRRAAPTCPQPAGIARN